MKKYITSTLSKSTLLIIAILLSFSALGAEAQQAAASRSDSTVFLLLVAFIIVLLIVIIVLASAIKNLAANKDIWINKAPKSLIVAVLATAGMLLPEKALAAGSPLLFVMSNTTFYLLIAMSVFLFLVALFLGRTLQNMLNELSGKEEESFITQLASNLTEAVPVEREEEVMTDHEYDGIRELDNVLPPWWVYLFYATIIFSVIYLIRYHVIGSGNVMAEEYQQEMLLAEAQKAAAMESGEISMIDENNVTILTAGSDLERGKSIFTANCASCHKSDGGGDIGPNLTDEYWLHGGGINNIFKTIKYGVTDKGMISWQAQLKPEDMQKVSSYILTLVGTNPPNAKEPQGELYIPEEPVETVSDTTATDTVAK